MNTKAAPRARHLLKVNLVTSCNFNVRNQRSIHSCSLTRGAEMTPFNLFDVANHALWWFAAADTPDTEAAPVIELPLSATMTIALETSMPTLPVLLAETTNEQGYSDVEMSELRIT